MSLLKADVYCPHCLSRCGLVPETGFIFCPDTSNCEYEYTNADDPPLTTAQYNRRRVRDTENEIAKLYGRIEKLNTTLDELRFVAKIEEYN